MGCGRPLLCCHLKVSTRSLRCGISIPPMSALGHVWTAPPWQELSELLQHWSGAVMCPACLCDGEAAGHNAMRGSGPNRKHAFKDALTHAGCPDPRIDLVCITSSVLANPSTSNATVVACLTSLNRSGFDATKSIALRCRRAGAVHSIKSRHSPTFGRCPLYPQKRTFVRAIVMSALCQKRCACSLRRSRLGIRRFVPKPRSPPAAET